MPWFTCSCGQKTDCKNTQVASVTFCRCRKRHVSGTTLVLPEKRATKTNTVFCFLTHPGSGLYKCGMKELRDAGVPRKNIVSSCGVKLGQACHGKRKLKANEVCHYSARFRWFPKVQRLIVSPCSFQFIFVGIFIGILMVFG
jgi:hypothetical protein